MELSQTRVRALRLHAHHLDTPLPAGGLLQAAAACGLQNSPPGAWETAAFNRVEDCSVCSLHTALHHDKTLLQAWSYRGVPVVFPTRDAGVFLTPLCARPGENPWIYTKGIGLALEFLGKRRRMLAADLSAAETLPEPDPDHVLLLGAHDPYLDLRDRGLILPDKKRQRAVWRTVGNPGVILQGGCVAGIWRTRTVRNGLELTLTPWEEPSHALRARLTELAERYAAFRLLPLRKCTVEAG